VRFLRPLDDGGEVAAGPAVVVLPRPLPERRSITFGELSGSLYFGCAGGVGVLVGGRALACVVYAATMLAEMRLSNSFTRSLSLVAVRCSVILWYPSMRASRRDAMVLRSDSVAAPFAGGTV
jgi:hypothetical protein